MNIQNLPSFVPERLYNPDLIYARFLIPEWLITGKSKQTGVVTEIEAINSNNLYKRLRNWYMNLFASRNSDIARNNGAEPAKVNIILQAVSVPETNTKIKQGEWFSLSSFVFNDDVMDFKNRWHYVFVGDRNIGGIYSENSEYIKDTINKYESADLYYTYNNLEETNNQNTNTQ